jgi:hypothetical protein
MTAANQVAVLCMLYVFLSLFVVASVGLLSSVKSLVYKRVFATTSFALAGYALYAFVSP